MSEERAFMERALELAARGRYSVSPNPMVGCVLVKDSEIIGEGFHKRAGLPHAEIEALRSCRSDPRGATAFVSLEPCPHFGKTPPCTDALIHAGIARVIVATEDPFPDVNGLGIEKLRDAGIRVEVGPLTREARALNEKFFHSIVYKRPFVLLKAGMSLDGKLATITGKSKWITSDESRQRNLELREEYDAILVGSGTVLADNPSLTRRIGFSTSAAGWTRVVLDTHGRIPPTATVLSDGEPTLLYTSRSSSVVSGTSATVIPLDTSGESLDLAEVLDDLGRRGIRSLLVEGGSLVHTTLIREKLWQKMILFVAPMLLGGTSGSSLFGDSGVTDLDRALRVRFDGLEQVGPDLMITAYPPEVS